MSALAEAFLQLGVTLAIALIIFTTLMVLSNRDRQRIIVSAHPPRPDEGRVGDIYIQHQELVLMTLEELAASLRSAHRDAPARNKTLHVQLWALRHADELNEYTGKVGKVVALADVGNWEAAINDMRKLAEYVTLDD